MKQLPVSNRSRSALAGENRLLSVRERSSAAATSRTASMRLPPETVASTTSSASAKMPGWCGVSNRLKLDSQRDQRDQSTRTASLCIVFSPSDFRAEAVPTRAAQRAQAGGEMLPYCSLLPPSVATRGRQQAGVATATTARKNPRFRSPLPKTSCLLTELTPVCCACQAHTTTSCTYCTSSLLIPLVPAA